MKLKQWWQSHKPSKRRLIQLYAALLFNANLKGFKTGRIYQGPLKNFCTPGLNCYSCPGASAACPMGALQNALSDSGKTAPYFVLGIILLYGLLFGRWICGFLCPFGLIQDLLHKIKTPKLKKSRVTRVLSYFKYVILAFFVVVFPLIYMGFEFPLPGFCKYICPAGTLLGAIGLLSNPANDSMLGMLGPLFTWKFLLLVVFLVGSVFIYRFFCRFFCPLGALYGLFNRISLVGVKLERDVCTNCGLCAGKCQMDIRQVGDHECINCGECLSVCPTGAIQWKGPKILLPPQAIGGEIPTRSVASASNASSAAAEAAGGEGRASVPNSASEARMGSQGICGASRTQRAVKRSKIARAVALVLMLTVLGGALYYYNIVDRDVPPPEVGHEVGETCYALELPLYNHGGGSFNVQNNLGKVTVINFWGTWCGPCVAELPHFDEVAAAYEGRVSVVAVHSNYKGDTALEFIEKNYPDTAMLFAQDIDDGGNGAYYTGLGGMSDFPMTIIVDRAGVITFTCRGSLSHDELVAAVEEALG